jgi:5-formyltetrahydrofolate cyclo-ligase
VAASRAASGPTLRDQKAALRRRLRERRARLRPDERLRRAALIERRLFAIPGFSEAAVVLLYSSFGTEVPTQAMIRRLLESGRRVFLPYLDQSVMRVAELDKETELVPSGYGPEEPRDPVAADPALIDVVVAPGLAFDRRGHRLGYGSAHYDRCLRSLPERVVRVGVGFHEQLVHAVPHGRGDEPLDFVVTDRETITCRPNRAR